MNASAPAAMNPYVGPVPFQREHENLFFGRQREIKQLLYLLIAERVVLLHSPSGAGKTSLIHAGLIPALEQKKKRFQTLPVMHVGRMPRPEDMEGLPAHNRYVLSALLSLEEELPGDERRSLVDLSAMEFEAYLAERCPPTEDRPNQVLIFDQFEELLTADPTDTEDKAEFFRQVGAALGHPRRWALFSMREDYLARLDPYLLPVPGRLETRFRLDLLAEEAALAAIQRPAAAVGVTFRDDAAGRLCKELSKVRVQSLDGTSRWADGPYAEPILLQVACQHLWMLKGAQEKEITLELVESIGNVDNALSAYYARQVAAIATETGVSEWDVRDWFEDRLITAQGVRTQVLQEPGQSGGLHNKAIERLVRVHLVRPERRRGLTWYELAHDRLIEPVRQNNDRWREKNLSPFYPRAVRWDAQNRPDYMLLTEGELHEMERWVKEHPERVTPEETAFLEASQKERTRARRQRRDAAERRTNLADLGWGIIFPYEDPHLPQWVPAVKECLEPLLELRRSQAGQRFMILEGAHGYRPNETAQRFLARYGVDAGMADPDKLPYYLLIVGDPETIPWEFQYALEVHYAVGRIHFDRPEEYTRYARSVVAAEQGQVILLPQAAFFGVQNPDDQATYLSAQYLVEPLAAQIAEEWPNWKVETMLGDEATKAQLARLLGGDRTPALLFTASHNMEFSKDDPQGRQERYQGALLCQDWPGPEVKPSGIARDMYLAGEDITDEAKLLGTVVFLWGSCTAGTPKLDDFAPQAFRSQRDQIAPHAFIARLPQRLLAHPQGGALAIIGHVERAWFTSFLGPRQSRQLTVFEEMLRRLIDGHTVGSAMEPFSQRYASLSSRLAEELQEIHFYGASKDPYDLAEITTATIDARNYVILGDPAVRLPVDVTAPAVERPAIEPVLVAAEPPSAEFQLEAAVEAPLRATEFVVCNGIDGASGQYLLPQMTSQQVSRIAQGETADETELRELMAWIQRDNQPSL